ncbi:MAG: hypothetical protein LAO76_02535 [Acidobacteriia bacterium]|nr:hypothetical protein [Terriglobia bacterium]
MNDQNRVLIRKGARNLTAEEVDLVKGGINTLTACTADPDSRSADGDASIGEC